MDNKEVVDYISAKLSVFDNFGYAPSPGQRAIHHSGARFIIGAAGARFGKSMAAGAEIAAELLLRPGARIWCVGPQYELADREFTWALEHLGKLAIKGQPVLDFARVTTAARGSRKITFEWGSYCQTKSTEKPSSLLGEELDMIVLCEASQIAREPWERMLRARLGPRHGRLLALSTPNADSGLFREFFQNGKDGKPDWESFQFSTLDNPYFSRDEYEIAQKELDEKVFKEQYQGEFVSRRGKVFDLQDVHIVEELPADLVNWPVFRGFQAGYQNPLAVIWVAISPSREFWVFDELYLTQALWRDVSGQIAEKTKGRRVICSLSDYRDEKIKEDLSAIGINARANDEKKYTKGIATLRRIQALQSVMKPRENGRSRLIVHKNCQGLIKELQECKWPDPQKEQAEKAEIELPLTKYLQAVSALSYVVAFVEGARGVDIYSVQAKPKPSEEGINKWRL